MKPKPRIFIGSSSEAKDLAMEVGNQLKNDAVALGWWVTPEFTTGFATLDGLLMAVETYDFAVFLFTPDDRCTSRNKSHQVPRDNVVFEYGLFLGRLGKLRTFAYRRDSPSSPLKLPSDVAGIHMPVIPGGVEEHELVASAANIVTEVLKGISQSSNWWRMDLRVISEWGIRAKNVFSVDLSVSTIRANNLKFRDKEFLLGIRLADGHVDIMNDPDIEFGSTRSFSDLDTSIKLIVNSRTIIRSATQGDVIEAYVFVVPKGFQQATTIAEAISQGGRLVHAVGQRIEGQKKTGTSNPAKRKSRRKGAFNAAKRKSK